MKKHTLDEKPPALATDGKGASREAMLEAWGKVPDSSGKGRAATRPQPDKDWHYLQVVKKRKGSRRVRVHIKVVYGDPEEVKAMGGAHTASVERTHLTSRHINGRLVGKTLSFSKELRFLEAASCWEDALDHFTRPVKTLRGEREDRSTSARLSATNTGQGC